MSENLRDEIADSLRSFEPSEYAHHELLMKKWRRSAADAVLAVVGPELDRLRAEVERLEGVLDGTAEHECSDIADIFGGYLCSCGQGSWLKDGCASPPEVLRRMAERVEAERDVLRARLANARIELRDGLADESLEATGVIERALAALASVPEPSDTEPCTTPGCPGDGRYAAPGRRHAVGCTYPQPSDSEPAPDADREAGER